MPVNTKLIKKMKYASHLPVTRSIVNIFDIDFCLELGAGIFSTPLLSANSKYMISVENSLDWINEVKNKQNYKNVVFKHHKLPDHIKLFTPYDHLNDSDRNKAKLFYNNLKESLPLDKYDITLLLVDQYFVVRRMSLSILHSLFKIVIIHDTHKRMSIPWRYHDFVPHDKYDIFKLEWHPNPLIIPSTSILIDRKINYNKDELITEVNCQTKIFLKEHKLTSFTFGQN